jgi:uncharacterized protein (DUF58 family)
VVAVRLGDRLENEMPAVGLVRVRDPETGETHMLDTRSAEVRDALRAGRQAARQAVITAAAHSGVDLLELDASRPFAEPLVAFFRRRARGR